MPSVVAAARAGENRASACRRARTPTAWHTGASSASAAAMARASAIGSDGFTSQPVRSSSSTWGGARTISGNTPMDEAMTGRVRYALKHLTPAQFLCQFVPAERARIGNVVSLEELVGLRHAFVDHSALLMRLSSGPLKSFARAIICGMT